MTIEILDLAEEDIYEATSFTKNKNAGGGSEGPPEPIAIQAARDCVGRCSGFVRWEVILNSKFEIV